MNTRLQVEHPVTEAITGVDLVEWQLRVAVGRGVALARKIRSPCAAMPSRRGFMPKMCPRGSCPPRGGSAIWPFPMALRVETGVRCGDAISPWYDPMIAKVIVHGRDARRGAAALGRGRWSAVQVAGTVDEPWVSGRLARHQGFAAGEVDTGLIERDLAGLVAEPVDRRRRSRSRP